MKQSILILSLLLLIPGCGFAYREVIRLDGSKDTFMVWTAFKEIHWGQYYSENDKLEIWAPWGVVKSKNDNQNR